MSIPGESSIRHIGMDQMMITPRLWSRRAWLARQAVGTAALAVWPRGRSKKRGQHPGVAAAPAERVAQQTVRLEPATWEALAQRAVEAAQHAGARYAEARLTRLVQHTYHALEPALVADDETIGIGIRALVSGYWGFAAGTVLTPDEVVRLAQDAVGQAKESAKGAAPRAVELGPVAGPQGRWATPVEVDPFIISVEEKLDYINYWKHCANQAGMSFVQGGLFQFLSFERQERVLVTSEGARVTQTLFKSGGAFAVQTGDSGGPLGLGGGGGPTALVHGIAVAGAGWERYLNAQIPEQFFSGQLRQEIQERARVPHRPGLIGKYTIICDGATMAALTEATLGVVTQLDRALGYEANAGGTSWLDDLLGLLGTAQVTAPGVTLTANRSAPQALATVQWDDEGVTPEDVTLIQDGVLVDMQTTREQAAWLKPYYERHSKPVRSHGYAVAENAHVLPLQQMPNVVLEPSASGGTLEALIASVPDGILITGGTVQEADPQARSGLLVVSGVGTMWEIRGGRLGAVLDGVAVLYDSPTLWKSVKAVGNASTIGELSWSAITSPSLFRQPPERCRVKGEPPQTTSHTVRAAAAVIANQPVIYSNRV